MNRWYDFREGVGGNLVDFGVVYFKCNVADFLERLSSPAIKTVADHAIYKTSLQGAEKKNIEVVSVHAVSSYALVKYLHNRRIHQVIADKFLKEVRYKSGDKNYYALGFKNNAGGYELRNENFKGSSSPKDVTLINNDSKELAVFEGFFNFLSYHTMLLNQEQPARNFLILNSTSFFEKSLPVMQEYKSVHLYLDNDTTGQNCTRQALELDSKKFKDERSLYRNHSDLNDWLIAIGNNNKQQLRQKL